MAAYTSIDDPSSVFQCTLYSGTGSQQSITNGGNSDLQPDFLWIKERTGTSSHQLVDSVRGFHLRLESDNTSAELDAGQAGATNQNVTSFDSDGFGVKNGAAVNESGETYVAWQWKETAGVFDIVTYTGNDTTRTISHSLGVIPKMIWVKERANANSWHVYNETLGNTKHLYLNTTHAAQTSSAMWNNTSPTSSVFTVSGETQVNRDGGTIIAYLFGDKQGVSKVGSYIGNGNADGPVLHCGFSPAFLLVKRSGDGTDDWTILDNKRPGYNLVNKALYPNGNWAEGTGTVLDFLSTGVKFRSNAAPYNASGATYIFMAFAFQPFVTSTGVPATAR